MAIAGTPRYPPTLNPVAVGVGCVVALVLVSFGLAQASNMVSWTLYTLAGDLYVPALLLWVALLLWAGVASVSDRVRRAGLPFGCLLGAPPCSRIVRWTWLGLIAVAAAAALFPGMVPSSRRGLTLRVGQPWRSTAAADAGRLVTRLTLGDRVPAWSPAPHVALSGWIFAPVSGEYHFELAARGDALLEVDGAPFMGVGDHGVEISRGWATDPSGARRAEGRLDRGFHQIALFYRPGEGPAGLRLRWTAPDVTRPRPIPVRYLLPDGTPPEARQWRARALTCRRIGLAALAGLIAVPLSGLAARAIARIWPSASGTRAAGRGLTPGEDPRRA